MSIQIIDLSIFERIQKLESRLKEMNERDRLFHLVEIYSAKLPVLGVRVYDSEGNLLTEYKRAGFVGRDE